MEWSYLWSDKLLLPKYGHNALDFGQQEVDAQRYRDIAFDGKGHCFPKVTWQLRRVHHLEAMPMDVRHPLSRGHYRWC